MLTTRSKPSKHSKCSKSSKRPKRFKSPNAQNTPNNPRIPSAPSTNFSLIFFDLISIIEIESGVLQFRGCCLICRFHQPSQFIPDLTGQLERQRELLLNFNCSCLMLLSKNNFSAVLNLDSMPDAPCIISPAEESASRWTYSVKRHLRMEP